MRLILEFVRLYEVLMSCKAFLKIKSDGGDINQLMAHAPNSLMQEFNRHHSSDTLTCIKNVVKNTISTIIGRLNSGTYLQKTIADFEFIMIAFTDEYFIHMVDNHSTISDKWIETPVEFEFYGSKNAGEYVFAKIDNFISNHSQIEKEMTAIYLTALALGFYGMYRSLSDRDGRIALHKNNLWKSFKADYEISDDYIAELDQQAYAHTVSRHVATEVNYLSIYKKLILVFAGLIVALYGLAFHRATESYFEIISKLC